MVMELLSSVLLIAGIVCTPVGSLNHVPCGSELFELHALHVTSALGTEVRRAQFGPGIVDVQNATAGEAVRFGILGDPQVGFKVHFTLQRPDGSKESLPSMSITPPYPRHPDYLTGPKLPKGCGGAVLIVEVYETDTGRLFDIGRSAVGF